MHEATPLPVFCFNIGEVAENLDFTIENISYGHLLTIEYRSVVHLYSEFAEPFSHSKDI